MKKVKVIGIWVIIVAVIVVGVWLFARASSAPSKLDGFASCLKDKGATFYGAFWCPHCQNQKALFGNAARFLPYVECSLPTGQGQTQVCIDKKVDSYPTWEFADGSRLSGEVSLVQLAEKTGCVLPQ